MLRDTLSGVSAGICIALGGSVFLATDNRVVGAVLFSVALLCICMKGYALFTGKVGFVPEEHSRPALQLLFAGLLGNLIGTFLCGLVLRLALPAYAETAGKLCLAKLSLPPAAVLVRGAFCGILMYLAVSIWKERQSPLGILFCIPVFILSGFEHSIADMFYFAVSGIVSLKAFVFLWLVIIGNALGAMLLPGLNLWGKGAKA